MRILMQHGWHAAGGWPVQLSIQDLVVLQIALYLLST